MVYRPAGVRVSTSAQNISELELPFFSSPEAPCIAAAASIALESGSTAVSREGRAKVMACRSSHETTGMAPATRT
jgi:hypothetical protein